MGAGIWITFGLGVSLMFAGFNLVVVFAIALYGMAMDKELKP